MDLSRELYVWIPGFTGIPLIVDGVPGFAFFHLTAMARLRRVGMTTAVIERSAARAIAAGRSLGGVIDVKREDVGA